MSPRISHGRRTFTEQERLVADSLDSAINQLHHAKTLWRLGMASENFVAVLADAKDEIDLFTRQAAIYDKANGRI